MLIPRISSDWWKIAGSPELGEYSSATQQTMDFGIWQAADRSWQLGACIRGTSCGGHTRLLYGWQSSSLELPDWEPTGILLMAEGKYGETTGGLQAPYVIGHKGRFYMVYGDWVNICLASSDDGTTFSRQLRADGSSALFSEGAGSHSRDPMVFSHLGVFYIYYTGVVENQGAIYCRTSSDLLNWSGSRIVSLGGAGGCGPADAECAFVCKPDPADQFYLFRWHSDGNTSVYCSDDPMDFGVGHDDKRVTTLPIEVARIIDNEGQLYISSLEPDYSGIRLARVEWVTQ